jgi:centromeric protein E
MADLNARIRQLTNLILTSQTLGEDGAASRSASPTKIDFDMSPYQLQQELLSARREVDTQATQILSLEAALLARPALAADAPDAEKDRMIADQARTIRELEMAVRGYEENLGAPLRQVREDVEREWEGRLEAEKKRVAEKEAWSEELVRQVERERQVSCFTSLGYDWQRLNGVQARVRLEEERRVLAAFVSKFDSLTSSGIGAAPPLPRPYAAGPAAAFERQKRTGGSLGTIEETKSPLKLDERRVGEPSLLEEQMQWDSVLGDESFELVDRVSGVQAKTRTAPSAAKDMRGKENLPL